MNAERDAADAATPASAARVIGMADARLAQLAAENRRLRDALHDARSEALDAAVAACAQAEVPSEAGGVWFLGLTDAATRQACIDAVRRLAYGELGRPPSEARVGLRDAQGA